MVALFVISDVHLSVTFEWGNNFTNTIALLRYVVTIWDDFF